MVKSPRILSDIHWRWTARLKENLLLFGFAISTFSGAAAMAATPLQTDSLSVARGTEGCDQACLGGIMDQFLTALEKRNAEIAPLAEKARYTENGVTLSFKDGLWRTFTAMGNYKHIFADAKAGQVGLFASFNENGVMQIASLRLKVEHRKITEAEMLIQRRQGSRFINTDGLALNPIWGEKLPETERSSRKELIAAVDPYFDGLIKGNGDSVPFDNDVCFRFENGIVTAGIEGKTKAVGSAVAGPDGPGPRTLSRCQDQFNAGGTAYVQNISPRRYLIVDEKRGLVYGIFHFEHPGDVMEAKAKDGTRRPMPDIAKRPFTVPVAELFKVRNGKIIAIEAVMTAVPYGLPAGW